MKLVFITAVVSTFFFFAPDAKLRRFHLVRPDLIPYPANIPSYC